MESESNSCEVPHRGIIVAKVLEYLAFKVQYKDATAKDYVPDFAERIEPEIALEVLMAADYLEGACPAPRRARACRSPTTDSALFWTGSCSMRDAESPRRHLLVALARLRLVDRRA